MNSYLGLVSEYAKVHKKKNRLTIVCIVISVMLITAIFGMADMSIRAQINENIRQKGNYHAIISDITDSVAAQIDNQRNVSVSGWVGMTEDVTFQGKTLLVQGGENDIAAEMNLSIEQGTYPQSASECALDRLAMEQLALSIGDTIQITDANEIMRTYVITGVYSDFSGLKASDTHGLYLSLDGIRAYQDGKYGEYFYVQFKDGVNINNALAEISAEYGLTEQQVSTNKMLLGLMGQSDDSSLLQLYLTAVILAILVAMAGTFMIASSFNMSILERTQFFGLLRCLGATKKQVKRYIRLEGLRYCAIGVPIGLLTGCCVIWAAVVFLNTLNSSFLPQMPIQFSLLGLLAGVVIGVMTVMLASRAPAKKAAGVSPQAAVTGNINQSNNQGIDKASNTKLFHVDTAMGLRHAFSNKKNLMLITGSFAISIVMFLCFSVFIDFMGNALRPLQPYAPDISVIGSDASTPLDRSLLEEIKELPETENVYARMFLYDIPASAKQSESVSTLISYDEPQFEWAKDALITGRIVDVQNGNGVFVEYSEHMNWNPGDKITLNINGENAELSIAGVLSSTPFTTENGEWLVICSEDTFTKLSGVSGYTIIDVQATSDISAQVRSLIGTDVQMLDKFQSNNETRATYNAMAVFVYGFLMIIAFVALINIVNTVNASVSSRMNNYGVMRAVGMSGKQLKKIITAEAAAYAITGSIAGSVLGLLLHRFFFNLLVTSNWGENWQPPLVVLAITILAALLTTFIAVISPAKKIEKMSIVNVVNAE